MRKYTIILAILLFVSMNAFAQSNWQWITTPTSYILFDISFPGNQNQVGYAVGENITYNGNGVIIKTMDGGDTWTQLNATTIPGLEAVCFTDTSTGYRGGWQNHFAKTTDGGATWTNININSNIWYITEIDFYDSLHGIVSAQGGEAYVTSDAGLSWTAATGLTTSFQDVTYANDSILYAVGGDEKIQKSVNGGLTWTQIYSGTFQSLFFGVDFYDLSYGIVTGEDGKVLYTSNGGTTWSTTNAGFSHLLRGAYMFDIDSALVAGTPEGVYVTGNGLNNFVSDFNGGNNIALYKIAHTPNNTTFICGSQGKILRKKPPLVADFFATSTHGCLQDSIEFFHYSFGSITSYEWSFPGGYPSTFSGPDPGKIFYASPGTYNVELAIGDGSTTDTMFRANYIHIGTPDTPYVAGDTTVLEYTTHTYTTTYHPGSQYSWTASGGAFTSIDSNNIDIQWGLHGQGYVLVMEENVYGCMVQSDTFYVDITLNVGMESNTLPAFNLYPNPANGWITIESLSSINWIIISDMSGRHLVENKLSGVNSTEVDVSQLSPGIYVATIIDGHGVKFSMVFQRSE